MNGEGKDFRCRFAVHGSCCRYASFSNSAIQCSGFEEERKTCPDWRIVYAIEKFCKIAEVMG